MSKIRVLVDGRWFDTYYSGVTTYLKGIYNSLAKDSDFEIFVIGKNKLKLNNEFSKNIQIIEFDTSSNFKRLYFDIPKLIKRYKFHYAHFQYVCPISKPCKYIVTLHDLLFLDYPGTFPKSFIYKNSFLFYISAVRSDLLLTVSEFSRKSIIKHFKIPEEKILVTPNGVLSSLESDPDPDSPDIHVKYGLDRYLLFVSRIEPRKNHTALIRAFLNLGLYKDFSLVFIGKMTIKVPELEDLLKNLPADLSSKIIILDNVSENELKSFYKNASLFVYPSLSEGFGIPPIEALSLGARTISSNSTALSDFEFLKDYQFDPHNQSQLEEKINKALTDTAYPHDDFKKIIRSKYNWDNIAVNFNMRLKNDI